MAVGGICRTRKGAFGADEVTAESNSEGDVMHYEDSEYKSSSSPFLKTFLRTYRGWDDAAQAEWADDVERRLREVTARIEPELVQFRTCGTEIWRSVFAPERR